MKVCVVGLGRLGLPWALLADTAGHEVRGLDLDSERVSAINARRVVTSEPEVAELLSDPNCALLASSDPAEALREAELSVVTVSTPSEPDGSFGLSAALAAMRDIGTHALAPNRRHVVVLKSTVSPGATEGALRSALVEAAATEPSASIGLVHAPEFHAIGSVVHDIRNPHVVIIGGSEQWAVSRAHELHASLAGRAVPVALLDAAGAELAKLASNSFRTMKIALANSLADLCRGYGSDPAAVCEAVGADPHIGRGYLGPGMPYGGPCYPRDNPALTAAAAAIGRPAPLTAATQEANECSFAALEQTALAVHDGPIGIAGIAFKAGTDELEGSPGLELARRWIAAKREVLVHDPLARAPKGTRSVTLAELVTTSSTVLLALPDESLATGLAFELSRCVSPPRVMDPWGMLKAWEESDDAIRPAMSLPAAGPDGR
jgi:UDPglucose 6-dehydrogenase